MSVLQRPRVIGFPGSSLSPPPGVHQQVPLQSSLQAGGQAGRRRVGQQSQLVENSSAEVVRNHGEAVTRALELEGNKNQAYSAHTYSAHLLTEKGTAALALRGPCGTDSGIHVCLVSLSVPRARVHVPTTGVQKRALDTMELDQVIVSLLIQVLVLQHLELTQVLQSISCSLNHCVLSRPPCPHPLTRSAPPDAGTDHGDLVSVPGPGSYP